jgi:hypothetical protein
MATLIRQDWGLMEESGFLNGGFTSLALNEATDQIEYIFQAQQALVVSRLGFRYNLRAGTPPTYKISLQGVDGSGRADGTIKGGGTPASATFTPPASTAWDATWQWVNLDNTFTIARGDLLAVVIIYSSGTVDASNNSQFTAAHGTFRAQGGLPYAVTFNATGSVTSRATGLACIGYGSTTVAAGYPIGTQTNVAINSGTSPNEIALFFTVPSGLANTVQVAGARLWCSSLVAATTHKLILYDTNGTSVLQTVTFDSDHIVATTNQVMEIYFTDATLASLQVGSTYRLAVQPQAATNIGIVTYDFGAAADQAAWPGGQSMQYSSKTAGVWTELATRRPMIIPLLADISHLNAILLNPSLEGT